MSKQEFWQHGTSGDLYAVELDESGKVIATCGPLLAVEVSQSDADAGNYECHGEGIGEPAWIESQPGSLLTTDQVRMIEEQHA